MPGAGRTGRGLASRKRGPRTTAAHGGRATPPRLRLSSAARPPRIIRGRYLAPVDDALDIRRQGRPAGPPVMDVPDARQAAPHSSLSPGYGRGRRRGALGPAGRTAARKPGYGRLERGSQVSTGSGIGCRARALPYPRDRGRAPSGLHPADALDHRQRSAHGRGVGAGGQMACVRSCAHLSARRGGRVCSLASVRALIQTVADDSAMRRRANAAISLA
jgi:hypothetical protein